jgi:formylmethanofuran dehydrogenase subunit A
MDVAGNDRADGMEFGFEGCRDAEVCAGTAESPEELGISLSVHIQCARIGGDEARGKQVVTASAEEP